MTTTLNFKLRQALVPLCEKNRLNVLIALVLHANIGGRCWPSIDTLCEETGISKPTVLDAKDWLMDHGALVAVPYDKRFSESEKQLPVRQTIYQLTGVIELDGVEIPYLYHENFKGKEFLPLKVKNFDVQNSLPKVSPSEDSSNSRFISSDDDGEGEQEVKAVRKRPVNADFKDDLAVLVYSRPKESLKSLWDLNPKTNKPKDRVAIQVTKTASEIVSLETDLLGHKPNADDYAQLSKNILAVLDYFTAKYPDAHQPTERFSKVYGEWVQAGRPGSKTRASVEVAAPDDPELIESLNRQLNPYGDD